MQYHNLEHLTDYNYRPIVNTSVRQATIPIVDLLRLFRFQDGVGQVTLPFYKRLSALLIRGNSLAHWLNN